MVCFGKKGAKVKMKEGQYNLSTVARRRKVMRRQSVEEIMHNTHEKLGYQRFHIQFRIYDAMSRRYISLPGTSITVNIDTPAGMEEMVKEVSALLLRKAKEREPEVKGKK